MNPGNSDPSGLNPANALTPNLLRIVFPEGDDPRVREAADFLEANALAKVFLLTGVDDLPQARSLVQDDEADAIIGRGATAGQEHSFLLLERDGKDGRRERVILTELDSLAGLDPEKLLGVQPRLTIFPGEETIINRLRAEHPLWLVGSAFKIDDINMLVVPDWATRDALASLLAAFTAFRVYGPISQAPILSAGIPANATTADIIATTDCVNHLYRAPKEAGKETRR
jgi:hypothetical protein